MRWIPPGKPLECPVVVIHRPGAALWRGVCVASEVARALGVPRDVIAAQELETPDYREYTIGAVAEGGGPYLDGEALRELELKEDAQPGWLRRCRMREAATLAREASGLPSSAWGGRSRDAS